MKNLNSALWLALITVMAAFTSCKKDIDANSQAAAKANAQSDLFGCKNCLITNYYDDNFIIDYGLNVSYNIRNQPDTLTINHFGSSYEAAVYDKFGRLSKVTFPDPGLQQQYWACKYDWSLLPTKMLLIVSNYKDYGQTDSINAIVYFRYNYKGEMIQMKQTNIWYPGYDITYNYKYDYKGNVKSVEHIPESGTPYTEYVFNSYDNKPNIMTGSMWIKYMLLYVGFDPLYPLLFSRNNAKDWMWYHAWQIEEDTESITSTFTYNNEGFANTINMNVIDNYYGDFSATRSAVSTCDNAGAFNLLNQPSVKPFMLQSRLKQLNKKFPFIPGNKQ